MKSVSFLAPIFTIGKHIDQIMISTTEIAQKIELGLTLNLVVSATRTNLEGIWEEFYKKFVTNLPVNG